MVLAMTRPFKHPKTGVFWFRKRIPADLTAAIGRNELTGSLDTRDPAEAKIRLLAKLSELEARWATLRAGARDLTEREAHALAAVFYERWIAEHRDNPSLETLWHPEFYKALWSYTAPDDEPARTSETRSYESITIPAMRRFCLVQADFALEHFGHQNGDWNRLVVAKAIGAAMQRADAALKKMREGLFEPSDAPADPRNTLANALLSGQSTAARRGLKNGIAASETLTGLVEGWWAEAKAAGRKPSTYDSYQRTVAGFAQFLGHDDATKVERRDVIGFKNYRLLTPSPTTGKVPSAKTVKDSDLSGLKAIFEWAVMNGKMSQNPATGITIKLGKRPSLRSKGFSDEEAVSILLAARRHQPGRETSETASAKRWVPWLCAFTGARVGEMAQLRKEDVARRGDDWIVRITPEAGTVKTNEAREVVLHPQLLELKFPEFVNSSAEGHLFLKPNENGDVLGPLQGLKNRLAEFARTIVADPNVAPNHGWRHRFKTVGMEAGIAPRILDAIQGQASRSVADSYGDVTSKTISREIKKLPYFGLGEI